MEDALRDLRDVVKNIVGEMRPYGARVLGIVERDGALFSEPCEFFTQLVSGPFPHPMRLPRMSISDYVGRARLHFGRKALEIDAGTAATTRFGALLSIKEYPAMTLPGMLDGLLQAPHEFVLTQTFSVVDKPAALERMNRLQRQIAMSDEAETQVETDLDRSRDSLVQQESIYGAHHLTLLCLTPKARDLDLCVSDLGALLTEMNVNWLREDLNLEPAFWAQLPGNQAYIARGSLISSLNFAGFVSYHNFARGQTENLHWRSPISLLETTSQTPYFFNFHQHDRGHFNVTGPTGSGKTVALTFLLAQAMRVRPEPRAVFFDKDRGAEIFIRAMGGRYEVLRPGIMTGFNPLQIDNTPGNRDFLFRLLATMLRPRDGGELSNVEEGVLREAVYRMMQEDRRDRHLSGLEELLSGRERRGSSDLASRLEPWLKFEERGWLFGAEEDRLSFADRAVFGFDMTEVLTDPEIRTAALMYIFHRIDEVLTGDPVMIFLDEGWQYLEDDQFLRFIIDKLKTIRKLNGIVGFGTQSARDIVKSKAANTLIEQSATDIHFPNPRADEDSYCRAFRLSQKEFRYIRETPPESRTFLIKHGLDSVIARLNLGHAPDLIKVLSGRVETVAELDRLRQQYGDDPQLWLPKFCGWGDEQ